ncbi:ABC transporter ATP-binding protein [Gottschalkia purinilytica]|uniref:ABC transporter ATP-binding protein n=1 Tax=Gottschalkia purinilytica TaxID=1503 RepID=A0A0L0W9P7_GOTPU|nr:ABC-F family ATP-binding cassette domain-containing protein [Gottschalkia purinilytica]KNF08259.1 ABC transporter ATP-binding protein [Gottschalkia purinilytica]
MSILNVENLSFGFGDKVLLRNASFRMVKGEHAGLVGANGAGKTTLFNILTGKLIPDEGRVYRQPSINIGYLDQLSGLEKGYTIRETLKSAFDELFQIEKEMLEVADKLSNVNGSESEKLLNRFGRLQDILYASDFYRIDSLVDNTANGLGLDILGMDTSVDKLSGGQRTKVKLAKLLLRSPDILFLDEPTNYLDKEHIEWLSNYLKDYPKNFMVISHDTEFLNNITNVIYNIEFANLKRYPGNYNEFLKLKDSESKRYIEQYNKQQQEIARLEDFISKNIVRASTSKRAKSRRKQLDKIERLEKPKTLSKPSFSFLQSRESGKLIFKSSGMDIGYNYPIISNLNLNLMKGEKIAITGCNGIGKSTLLKTILGIIPSLKGKVELGDYLYPIYFEQESATSNNTPVEEIWNEFPQKSQKEIREALAKCGLSQKHVLQKMSTLSGGEQAKVRICKLMMKPSNWIIFDEPTNHLDVDAKSALKEALINYDGTILLVCHEKEFYQDWITGLWNIEEHIISSL